MLCPAFAKDQAKKAGHGLLDELHLLTVHGVLHLLGYDHAEPAEEREMFTLQNRILARLPQPRGTRPSGPPHQRSTDDKVLGAVGLDEQKPDQKPEAMTASPASLIWCWPLCSCSPPGCSPCADAALGTVSRARVEALQRQGRWGAGQLLQVVADRPRHVNLLLLLRLVCELSATVLVTVVFLRAASTRTGSPVLSRASSMLVVSYVLVGVGPRTLGRQHPYARRPGRRGHRSGARPRPRAAVASC